jgi:hypothetical protein
MKKIDTLNEPSIHQPRFPRLKKSLLLVTALALLSLVLAGVTVPQAHAAAHTFTSASPLCSGHGCDDRDPYTTHCAGQSWDQVWVVVTSPIKNQYGQQIGYTQLWWSQTCQTNWARIVAQVPHVEIDSQLDIQWTTSWEYARSGNPPVNAIVTAQMYAPVALAGAWGKIWTSNTVGFTGCATQIPPDYLCN